MDAVKLSVLRSGVICSPVCCQTWLIVSMVFLDAHSSMKQQDAKYHKLLNDNWLLQLLNAAVKGKITCHESMRLLVYDGFSIHDCPQRAKLNVFKTKYFYAMFLNVNIWFHWLCIHIRDRVFLVELMSTLYLHSTFDTLLKAFAFQNWFSQWTTKCFYKHCIHNYILQLWCVCTHKKDNHSNEALNFTLGPIIFH